MTYWLLQPTKPQRRPFRHLTGLIRRLEIASDIDAYAVEIDGVRYPARQWLARMHEWQTMRPELLVLGLEWQEKALAYCADNCRVI